MTFDITIIGYIAGFCTAFAQFPQALKAFKTDDTQSISRGMYTIMTLGIFFCFLKGFLLSNIPHDVGKWSLSDSIHLYTLHFDT